MNIYATEEEQIEVLTDFLKRYGTYILLSLGLIIAGLLGWHQWKQYNINHINQSSVIYEQFRTAMDDNSVQSNSTNNTNTDNKAKINKLANQLASDYSSTVYGQVASTYFAGQLAEQGKWAEAAKKYQEIYLATKQWPELQIVVFENWVRSLVEASSLDKALQAMQNLEDQSSKLINLYPANYYNLKGDVLAKQNNNSEAMKSYDKALQAINNNPAFAQQMIQFVNWINLKRNDLQAAKPLVSDRTIKAT